MNDRLASIERDYTELEVSLGSPEVLGDQNRLREASRKYKQLTPLIQCIRDLRDAKGDAEAAKELMAETSGEEREAFRAEATAAEAKVQELDELLKVLLLPPDPNDGKNVLMEIRGAEGGEEANLFARDLMEMYMSYAAKKGWQVETIQADNSEMGGINQATLMFKGDDAWSHLRFEGGPHVNTTDSAVRITHKPTGLVVAMQDERSQLQNRARAMTVLRSRLLKLRQEEQEAAASAERRAQIGGGGRGEKIRTYNYKENRITDHRIGFTLYQLQAALSGELDPVIDALSADLRARQLADHG